MKASEKIRWLTALLVLWGTMYPVLLMVLLKVYEISTAIFLLALSYRLVYLRGRNRR